MTESGTPARSFTELSATAGKAARTRAQLLDAAVRLYARRGWGRASAHEICAEAGVANGTFYRYFADRDAIDHAAAIGLAELTAAQLAQNTPESEDARVRVASMTKRFIAAAIDKPWGQLLSVAIASRPELRRAITVHIRADVERGVQQGHFSAVIDEPLIDALGALAMAGLMKTPDQEVAVVATRMATYQLVLLGVDPELAASIASS